MTPDDAELIRRYRCDLSEDALAELVQRHMGLVYRTALRQVSGRSRAAEEIAQSVFVLLARKAGALLGHPSIAGWLHTTTRWVAADFLRGERRRHVRETQALIMHELSGENPASVEWEQMRPAIDDALGELKPADREAILLRYFAGLPVAEIGERLALSEGAARMRIERALDRLRGPLVRRGVTSTAAALAAGLSHSSAVAVPAGLVSSATAQALAATATASAGAMAIGAITFMNHAKLLVGVAVLVGVGGVGSALYENAAARRAESALHMANTRQRTLEAQLTVAEERIAASTRVTGSEQTQHATLIGNVSADLPASVNGAGSAPPPGEKRVETVVQALLRDPAYVEAQIKFNRAGLALTYGPFYRSLHLAPAQVAEFEEAMSEYFQANIETASAAGEQGLAPNDPKLMALMKAPIEKLNQRLLSSLGRSGIEQLAPYDQSTAARLTVNALAGNLYYTEVPLTLDQANQLTAMVAANTSQLQSHGLTAAPRQIDWNAILLQAEGILAPTQLATLRSLSERQRYEQQSSDIAGRASHGSR